MLKLTKIWVLTNNSPKNTNIFPEQFLGPNQEP